SDVNGAPLAWNLTNPTTPIVQGGRINYRINSAGSDNVPFAQVEQAITASFQSWEDISTSAVAFTRGPNTTSTATTSNGQLELFWLENSETTQDGLNLAGALALTRRQFNPATGEITDGAIFFNGFRYTWAVSGRADAVDIQDVATHEIGHLIGLSHSPIGGMTMYPRTIAGRTQNRVLGPDDIIGASVIYPEPGFLNSTGTIRGRVAEPGGANVFGAHVVAVDANGNATASALSQPDGSYSIQGLPPGAYTMFAEPLDPLGASFFSRGDLEGFYGNTTSTYSTSNDVQVSVAAGGTATQNFTLTRETPALGGYQVRGPESTDFLNLSGQVPRGASNVIIGVNGPGLPQSGTPLSISGAGITIHRTTFTTTSIGLPAVQVEISVSPTAALGSRNLIISSGGQRTVVVGGLEIIPATTAAVSSANFAAAIAQESLVSVFGQNLATATVVANSTPLPTSLGGTSIRLRDFSGQELLAPLFFISPGQINFQMTPGLLRGPVLINIGNANGLVSTGALTLDTVAPGLFSANGSGQGVAAAVAFRLRANGTTSFEPVSRFDQASGQAVAVPIDLGPATDQVFLILFATGVRYRSALSAVSYNIGGLAGTPQYAGSQNDFVG
ncbi:MAG TPA: matrixin family metalloprotease, partial [Blastocatellia bacterium]|nr:matrixin family metalloprotease [Blastocatellia bacterium]